MGAAAVIEASKAALLTAAPVMGDSEQLFWLAIATCRAE